MTQIVIDIGAVPNDGTGDPLRTAFNDVNLNFANVFAAGPVDSNIQIVNNRILTVNTNGNLVLNPNGIGVVQANAHVVPDQYGIRNLGSSSKRWGTIYTQYLDYQGANISYDNLAILGNITAGGFVSAVGNVTGNYLFGNGNQLTGINKIANGNSYANIASADGNLVINVGTDGYGTWIFETGTGNLIGPGNISQGAGIVLSAEQSVYIREDMGQLNIDAFHTVITSNSGNVGNTQSWDFDNAGNLTAPGNILMSNIGGIYSSSAGYVVGLQMSNTEPSVKLVANDHEWMFDPNGVLKFPAGYSTTYPAITMGEPGNLLIQGYLNSNFSEDGGNIIVSGGFGDGNNGNATVLGQQVTVQAQLSATNGSPKYNWTFDALGNLTVPGNIIGSGNILIAPDSASASSYLDIYLTGGPDIHIASNDNSIVIGRDTGANVFVGNDGEVSIRTDNGATAQVWNFTDTGNLTLPGNTFAVNYANGDPVIISGGTANTGNVTFSDQIVIGTGISNLVSGLYLAPSSSSANAVQYLRVRGDTSYEPTHIHFDTGNNQYFNQFIGDDNKYVLLSNTGNIVINTDNYVGNSAQWTFGADGNLSIPGGGALWTLGSGTAGLTANIADPYQVNLGLDYTANTATLNANNSVYIQTNSGNTQWAFLANSLMTAPGSISAVGNITANNIGNVAALNLNDDANTVLYGNGVFASVAGGSSYGNSNVATFLGNFGSNVVSTTGNISAGNVIATNIGNIASINLDGNASTVLYGNGVFAAVAGGGTYGDSNVNTLLAAWGSNTISTTGNITSGYLFGNGSQLTGLPATYGNSNVATFLASFGSNAISTSGNITAGYVAGNGSALTNLTGANVSGTVANATYATSAGSATTATNAAQANYANIANSVSGSNVSGSVAQANYANTANAVAGGNVSGQVANALIAGTVYTNAQPNITSIGTLSSVSVTANITGGNVLTGGLISSTGNVTGGNIRTAGQISATGNATFNAVSLSGTSGNITGADQVLANAFSASGNVTSGGLTVFGSAIITGNTTVQGTLTYNNLTNITTPNLVFGLANTSTGISANGAGFVVGNTSQASFLYNYGTTAWNSNIAISAVGNLTGGNVLTGGIVSATGNITGGNISATNHTGTTVSVNGNVTGGNVLTGGLVSATATITGGNLATGGTASATGNITGGNVLTGGLISATGTITGTSHLGSVVSVTANITGGNVVTGGVVSATGNVTGNYILGNGALLTGVITSVANINSGTSNVTVVSSGGNITVGVGGTSNVAVFATTGEYVTGVVSATGNITGGNVLTGGLISSTGNITGGNISATNHTGTTVSVSGNITGGNVLTGGLVSATGNITGGNVLTAGLISATGNITGGNISATNHTGTTVSVTGNITAGNIINTGISSVTGNITGGNIATAGQVSATGNVTTANYFVGNLVGTTVSTTGNISAGNVIINGQSTTYGVVTPAYMVVGLVTSVSGFSNGSTFILDTVVGNTNSQVSYNSSTGVFTLTAGVTYDMSFTPSFITFSNTTTGFFCYDWVDATSNVQLDTTGIGTGTSISSQDTTAQQDNATARVIYTPNTNQTVKLRVTNASGTVTLRGGIGTQAIIKPLNPTIAVQATATGTVAATVVANTSPVGTTINGGSNASPALTVLTLAIPTAGTWRLDAELRVYVPGAGYMAAAFYDNGTLIPNSEYFVAAGGVTQTGAASGQYGGFMSYNLTTTGARTVTVGIWSTTSASMIDSGDGRTWARATQIDSIFALNTLATMSTTGNVSVGGNITATGNISATGSILAVPAWTSVGAITFGATTTAPTKPTTRVKDNISYRQLGAKQWEVIMSWQVTNAAGAAAGSGDFLFTLPNSLQFDTTLPSQSVYTSNVQTSTWAHIANIIPSGSGMITNLSVGGQVYPMVYSSTQFRILGYTYSSGVQAWGSGFFSVTDTVSMQLTFRFTST